MKHDDDWLIANTRNFDRWDFAIQTAKKYAEHLTRWRSVADGELPDANNFSDDLWLSVQMKHPLKNKVGGLITDQHCVVGVLRRYPEYSDAVWYVEDGDEYKPIDSDYHVTHWKPIELPQKDSK